MVFKIWGSFPAMHARYKKKIIFYFQINHEKTINKLAAIWLTFRFFFNSGISGTAKWLHFTQVAK